MHDLKWEPLWASYLNGDQKQVTLKGVRRQHGGKGSGLECSQVQFLASHVVIQALPRVTPDHTWYGSKAKQNKKTNQ